MRPRGARDEGAKVTSNVDAQRSASLLAKAFGVRSIAWLDDLARLNTFSAKIVSWRRRRCYL
jgi:hypothetical protein